MIGDDSSGASGDAQFTGVAVPNQYISPAEEDLGLMRRIAEASEFQIGVAFVRNAISQADAARRLRLAVEIAASRDAIAMDALRLAVCEFTFALRREGSTPEAVLIRLKELIDHETLPLITTHPSDHGGHRLRENISTWCINSYFDNAGACL